MTMGAGYMSLPAVIYLRFLAFAKNSIFGISTPSASLVRNLRAVSQTNSTNSDWDDEVMDSYSMPYHYHKLFEELTDNDESMAQPNHWKRQLSQGLF
jgi:hypothetical protein